MIVQAAKEVVRTFGSPPRLGDVHPSIDAVANLRAIIADLDKRAFNQTAQVEGLTINIRTMKLRGVMSQLRHAPNPIIEIEESLPIEGRLLALVYQLLHVTSAILGRGKVVNKFAPGDLYQLTPVLLCLLSGLGLLSEGLDTSPQKIAQYVQSVERANEKHT